MHLSGLSGKFSDRVRMKTAEIIMFRGDLGVSSANPGFPRSQKLEMVPGGSTAGGALQGRPSRGNIPRKTGEPAGYLCPRGGSSRRLFYFPLCNRHRHEPHSVLKTGKRGNPSKVSGSFFRNKDQMAEETTKLLFIGKTIGFSYSFLIFPSVYGSDDGPEMSSWHRSRYEETPIRREK